MEIWKKMWVGVFFLNTVYMQLRSLLLCVNINKHIDWLIDWLSMVLRLRQHNIGYTAEHKHTTFQ